MILHLDLESRSAVDLKRCGAYVYAEDSSTDIWCACYAFDDGPVEVWLPGEPVPLAIAEHVIDGGVIYAHNAAFERVMWKHILGPRYGWPEPEIAQWRCTMVMALAMALPGGLEEAAPAAGIDLRKDAAGRRLMLQMARPRKLDLLTWWDEPAKVERLIEYCKTDVEVERQLHERLRPLKDSELDLWHLDQRINDRGVHVDVKLCHAAMTIVTDAKQRLDGEMSVLTCNAVRACGNRSDLVPWLRGQGVADVESIAKDQVELLLARDLSAPARRALELRQEAAKASVAKIDVLLKGMSRDGRARGLLQFHAAGTGRWGGRRFQPQNLPRTALEDVDTAISFLLTGDAELVDSAYGRPLSVVSDCIRGMISAAPGHKLISVDYANIEGRVLAWLAGETGKVRAFANYDAGVGPDIYKLTYANAFSIRIDEVQKSQRQVGKVMELALGYQGGVGAFQTMAANYGVALPDAAVAVIRDRWRGVHPNIKRFWWDLDAAATKAVQTPGSTHIVRDIVFRVAGSFLFMRLPSKRFLAYANPSIQPKLMPWKDDHGGEVWKDSVSYMGINSYSRQWERCFAYGGLLAENATQAVARDILADAMPRLEAAGYPIILTVHDEIVVEPPTGFGSVAEVASIMTDLPDWGAGCPVAAEGWEGARYRKG